MTSAQKWILMLQGIFLLFAVVYLGFELLKARQENLKYKLYAVRDDLIYLVATNELEESSYLFRVFYTAITRSISAIEDLTVWSFVRASMTAKSALQKEAEQRLDDEIKRASPEVQKVVFLFVTTMLRIITANSPFLLLFVNVVKFSHRWGQSGRRTARTAMNIILWKLLPGARERYDTYLYFDDFYDHHNRPLAA